MPIFKFKTNKNDEMIEFESEEVPQNCKQEDERYEKAKNKITSHQLLQINYQITFPHVY